MPAVPAIPDWTWPKSNSCEPNNPRKEDDVSLLLTMLPLYVFGNLHCAGMCGPLVMLLGTHRYRYFYFLGRILSFSLAGMLAGEAGAVVSLTLRAYHIPVLASFLVAGGMGWMGISSILGKQLPGLRFLAAKTAGFNRSLSLLLLRDQPWPSFLFGFFTLALPCGQTIVVFSACAMSGDAVTGLLNGFAFALLTSPSLYAAMHASRLLSFCKKQHHLIMGISALAVGFLAFFRGCADLEWIPHLIVNPQSLAKYHLVIY
jgi:hypothetical protein